VTTCDYHELEVAISEMDIDISQNKNQSLDGDTLYITKKTEVFIHKIAHDFNIVIIL
jgi:hypothetical protein